MKGLVVLALFDLAVMSNEKQPSLTLRCLKQYASSRFANLKSHVTFKQSDKTKLERRFMGKLTKSEKKMLNERIKQQKNQKVYHATYEDYAEQIILNFETNITLIEKVRVPLMTLFNEYYESLRKNFFDGIIASKDDSYKETVLKTLYTAGIFKMRISTSDGLNEDEISLFDSLLDVESCRFYILQIFTSSKKVFLTAIQTKVLNNKIIDKIFESFYFLQNNNARKMLGECKNEILTLTGIKIDERYSEAFKEYLKGKSNEEIMQLLDDDENTQIILPLLVDTNKDLSIDKYWLSKWHPYTRTQRMLLMSILSDEIVSETSLEGENKKIIEKILIHDPTISDYFDERFGITHVDLRKFSNNYKMISQAYEYFSIPQNIESKIVTYLDNSSSLISDTLQFNISSYVNDFNESKTKTDAALVLYQKIGCLENMFRFLESFSRIMFSYISEEASEIDRFNRILIKISDEKAFSLTSYGQYMHSTIPDLFSLCKQAENLFRNSVSRDLKLKIDYPALTDFLVEIYNESTTTCTFQEFLDILIEHHDPNKYSLLFEKMNVILEMYWINTHLMPNVGKRLTFSCSKNSQISRRFEKVALFDNNSKLSVLPFLAILLIYPENVFSNDDISQLKLIFNQKSEEGNASDENKIYFFKISKCTDRKEIIAQIKLEVDCFDKFRFNFEQNHKKYGLFDLLGE